MNLVGDLRFAVRILMKSPGTTAVFVLTLALGIGPTLAIFALSDAVLFRPLPVKRPSELVRVLAIDRERGTVHGQFSLASYREYRERTRPFLRLAAHADWISFNFANGRKNAERITGAFVSGDFFEVIGVSALRGRLLTEDDDAPGRQPVAVLSERLWRRRFFGVETSALGREVHVNGQTFTVVGIVPEEFYGFNTARQPLIWIPLARAVEVDPVMRTQLGFRSTKSLNLAGRLTPEVTFAEAQSRLDAIGVPLSGRLDTAPESTQVRLVPLDNARNTTMARVARVSIIAVSLVLLIANLNAALLLLARASGRGHEMSIRQALGAGRARLARQLVVEGLLLTALAAPSGALLAAWMKKALLAAAPANLPLPPAGAMTLMDSRLFMFAAVVVVLEGVVLSMAPLWGIGGRRSSPAQVNAMTIVGSVRMGRDRSWRTLIVTQFAASLVLLAATGALLKTLANLTAVTTGVDARNTVVASLDLFRQGHDRDAQRETVVKLTKRIQGIPGVRHAAIASSVPPQGAMTAPLSVVSSVADHSSRAVVDLIMVTPDSFDALGVPLLRGRGFNVHDDRSAAPIGIVNETFVRTYWPDAEPIGKALTEISPKDKRVEIVGVAADVRFRGARSAVTPALYVPLSQFYDAYPYSPLLSLVVRSSAPTPETVSAIVSAAREVDENLPLYQIRTLQEQLATALAEERFLTRLFVTLGALGLLLAAFGLFGVIAHMTASRTRELGLRLALGARPAAILRSIMSRSVRLAVVGMVFGLGLAIYLQTLLAPSLFRARLVEPVVLATVAATLIMAALVAAYVPARRAAKIDPAEALRRE